MSLRIDSYTLTCQHCGTPRVIDQVASAGLKLGDLVPRSPSEPDYGRCVRCKRYKLVVTEAPQRAPAPGVKGFTKVPTK